MIISTNRESSRVWNSFEMHSTHRSKMGFYRLPRVPVIVYQTYVYFIYILLLLF